MSTICIYPSINLDDLMADPELEVTDNIISLKTENSSAITITLHDSEEIMDIVELCGSLAVLRHLAEKYNYLFIASDIFYCKGDEFVPVLYGNYGGLAFIDFATLEMLNFKDEYGWSEEFINKLVTIRKENRDELGVKMEYKVGDVVNFDYCGPDATSCMSGRVIFTDKHHTIVRVSCYTRLLAIDLCRKTLSSEQVEAITGKSIDELRVYEHDRFVDMNNALTFIQEELLL